MLLDAWFASSPARVAIWAGIAGSDQPYTCHHLSWGNSSVISLLLPALHVSFLYFSITPYPATRTRPDGDQAQEDMEANQQDQDEVEAQIEDPHGGQIPPQRITRSMFKALGARGHLFSLFVISLVEGA